MPEPFAAERLQGSGLSFIEMNYVLLQAYDFLELRRRDGITLLYRRRG